MFESSSTSGRGSGRLGTAGAGTPGAGAGTPGVGVGVGALPGAVGAAVVARWVEALAGMDREVSDAERVDRIRVLEELKSAAAAAQAREAVDLDISVRRAQAAAGMPAHRRGQGVGAQVALARRESPARGGRCLGLAKALVTEMPHTLAALSRGQLSEWRATLLVRESACLSVADRAVFDAELCAEPGALEGVGDRRLVAQAKRVAQRLDVASVVRRARKAESERMVTLRPAPETMAYLTALLPVAQGVAVHAALTREAELRRCAGDGRGRGQIMADTLVERVTGHGAEGVAKVEVQLIMTDRALLGRDDEPAVLPGYGTVPAQWARDLIRATGMSTGMSAGSSTEGADRADRAGTGAGRGSGAGADPGSGQVWLRRLFTAPTTGRLIGMDSRARRAPAGLARFIDARDQTCRQPWCDAPIRHRDHVVAHEAGGPTSGDNLQGLCEACNHAKQAPGWRARPIRGPGRHRVEITTPTGHTYSSTAPPLPGTGPPAVAGQDALRVAGNPGVSVLELRFAEHLLAA